MLPFSAGRHEYSARQAPETWAGVAHPRLTVTGMSKTFGMTGWRLGSLALPQGTAKAILKFIQDDGFKKAGPVSN